MKDSLGPQELYPQQHPSNRREVMKKGLGLTLGSSALGLAGLSASSPAQAWGPWHTTVMEFNTDYKPGYRPFPDDLSKVMGYSQANPCTKIVYYWRNSNDAMWKDGTAHFINSSGDQGSDFYGFNFKHIKLADGRKDLDWSTMAFKRFKSNYDYQLWARYPTTDAVSYYKEDSQSRELRDEDKQIGAIVRWLNEIFLPQYAADFPTPMFFTTDLWIKQLKDAGFTFEKVASYGGVYLGGKKIEMTIKKAGNLIAGLTIFFGFYFGQWTGLFLANIPVTFNGAINDINAGIAYFPAMALLGITTAYGFAASVGLGWATYALNHANNTANQDITLATAAFASVFVPAGLVGVAYCYHMAARMRISSGLQALITQNPTTGSANFQVI
jgi:hypothetical protein